MGWIEGGARIVFGIIALKVDFGVIRCLIPDED